MKKRFLLMFLTLLLIMAAGCANEEPTDSTNQNTDNAEVPEEVDEIEVVGGGTKIDYAIKDEEEIFGNISKEEIVEIVDEIFEKVSDDEDYENNIDSIIEEVFKNQGITDEDNLDAAKTKLRISKPQ